MSISRVHMCRRIWMHSNLLFVCASKENWFVSVGVGVLCWFWGCGVRVYVYCVLLILGFLWIWREHAYNVNQADCTQNFRRASNSLVYFELPTYQQINRANPISIYLFLIVFVAPSIKVQCYWCGIYIFLARESGVVCNRWFVARAKTAKTTVEFVLQSCFVDFQLPLLLLAKTIFLFNTFFFANDFFCSS